jgi:hypothetical protein
MNSLKNKTAERILPLSALDLFFINHAAWQLSLTL